MEDLKSKNKKTNLTREILLSSPEFWLENIRTELFNMIQDYLDKHEMTRKQLADQLGVTKGYISQLLNGDSDHRLSKLVELAVGVGFAPYLYFKDLEEVLDCDKKGDSIYIDFKELEEKAFKCDILEHLHQDWNKHWEKSLFLPWRDADDWVANRFDIELGHPSTMEQMQICDGVIAIDEDKIGIDNQDLIFNNAA